MRTIKGNAPARGRNRLARLGAVCLAGALYFPGVVARAAPVDRAHLDHKTISGIVRCMRQCDPQDAADLGLRETGLAPVFDAGLDCPGIDEGWAIDYSARRSRDARHGGIDIPAARGTPILAVADGEVVALFDNRETAVGIRIFLQHAPEQTGKPFWAYSEYAHLRELPPLSIGQAVRRGDVVGYTSNTGISGAEARARAGDTSLRGVRTRRDALHFSILYSESPDYAVLPGHGGYLVPVGARWMDPVAFFRATPPYDAPALAALTADDKRVAVPAAGPDGKVRPAGGRLIWPYACSLRE